MSLKKWMISCGVGIACATMAVSAHATVYDFSISTSQDTASGQFTVSAANQVTLVTGQVDGSAITGLSAYGLADNLLQSTAQYVDRSGLAFTTANGLSFNIFTNYGTVYSFCNSAFNGGCTGGDANNAPVASFKLSAASAVPEPATWALLMIGIGATGAMMRRRKEPLASASFA
jgi:hypothetical protein